MKRISIIGFGRFGKTLLRLIEGDFEIRLFDVNPQAFRGVKLTKITARAKNVKDALESDVVFYAVPIAKFGQVLRSHARYFRPDQLLIDVLSVKAHPARIFSEVLGSKGPRAMLTHPMFGPDSSKDGFRGLPIVMHRFAATRREYGFWKRYFRKKGLRTVELSPEAHDRLAADSQGVAHFLGRLLGEIEFKRTPIDTLGVQKLQEVKAQACNDTRELFRDLQTFNPHTRHMRLVLGHAYEKIYNRLLPAHTKPGKSVFGIQGGRGSFNEQAILEYIKKKKVRNAEIKYLFTSERVLKKLHEGDIDFGLFAIQNAVGGMVGESVAALSRYTCRIAGEFPVRIRHFLMKRGDNPLKAPRRIMAHDQVFRQCKATLKKKYPRARLMSGKGDMKDTARAAEALAKGKLPRDIFILGPKRLAEIYGFHIVARELQDDKNNDTTFLLVRR